MEDIVCHSVYDYDTVYELNKFFLNRRGRSNRFLNVTLITVNVIMLLIFVLFTAILGFDLFITVAILFIALLDAIYIFSHVALPKIISKKASAVVAEITFRFKEDEIEIEAKKPNFIEKLCEYLGVKKVKIISELIYENEEFFD